VLTSIRADEAADTDTLEAGPDPGAENIHRDSTPSLFTPTMGRRCEAKLVGDRIYLLMLLADAAGKPRRGLEGRPRRSRAWTPR